MSTQAQIQKIKSPTTTPNSRKITQSVLSGDVRELKRECETFEARLYQHFQNKRQQKISQIEDAEATDLLSCLFEIYEDLISLLLSQQSESDVGKTKKEVSDTMTTVSEKSWKLIYARIEELRKIEDTNRNKDESTQDLAAEALKRHLYCSETFYQNLILGLILRFDLHENNKLKADWKSACAHNFVYDCYIRLGDIARYQASMENNLNSYLWIRAQDLHLRAVKMKPDDGLPYAKIGIVATNMNDDFNTLYWFLLSSGNITPTVIAKENLKVMYKRRAKKSPPDVPAVDATLREKLSYCSSLFLEFHKNVFFCDQVAPANMLTQYGIIVEQITDIIDSTLSNRAAASFELDFLKLSYFLKKVIVILVISFNDLNGKFKESGSAGVKQQIRHVQVIILAMFFDILCKLLDTLQSEIISFQKAKKTVVDSPNGSCSINVELEESGDANQPIDLFSTFFSDNGVNPMLYLFQTVGIGCIWFSSSLENITQYKTYIKTVSQGDREKYLVRRLFRFAHSLANIMNTLFTVIDMEESSELLFEDEELLGTTALRDYYREKVESESIKHHSTPDFSHFLLSGHVQIINENIGGFDSLQARLSRIALLARKMSEDERCDFFSFDGEESKFSVTDEQSKRDKLKMIGQMMGRQRLKEEIDNLEKKVKDLVVPTIVLGQECFISDLRKVKDWIMSNECIVVVALSVLRFLDENKKGDKAENANARQANRFLDSRLKYSTKYIRLQKPGEELKLWDNDGSIGAQNGITPAKPAISIASGDSPLPMTVTIDSGFSEMSISQSENLQINQLEPLPESFRSLLACCLHFQKETNVQSLDAIGIPFTLVTNSKELSEVALKIGVPTATMKEWDSVLAMRHGGKRRVKR